MGWKSNHDFPWAKCLCRKILQLSLKILIDIGGSWSRATCSKMRFVSKKGVTKCHQAQYSSSSPGIKGPTSTAHHKNSGSRGKKTQTHGHTAHITCISRGLRSFRYSSYLPSTKRGTGKSYRFLSPSGGVSRIDILRLLSEPTGDEPPQKTVSKGAWYGHDLSGSRLGIGSWIND